MARDAPMYGSPWYTSWGQAPRLNARAEVFGDIEIDEVRVMKDDRFDTPLHFIAFVGMGRDDMHDFRRDAVFVTQCDA